MWYWFLTLIVFGHLQDGIKSNPLSVADKGYVYTAGIGYHKIHSLANTSHTARSICQKEGGDLAIIDSDQEKQVIVELFATSLPHIGSNDSNYAHVGLHDRVVDSENQTIQVQNSEQAVYAEQRWNRNVENCDSIDRRGWLNGISCNQSYAFVCERPEYEEVELNVTVAKEPTIEGAEVSITCYVVGYPASRVLWYKDDYLIQTNDRINISGANNLIIPSANKNDTGKYRCKSADNYMIGAHTVNIRVIVPVKVKITVDKGSFPERSEIGIVCNTDGYPTPIVHWYKDDNLIHKTERINIVANKLIIASAEKNDAGKYRCEAINEYTSSAETVDVRVASLGANSQGCHMTCEDSTFGCCVDGTTPAHGSDKEGCCLATLYGCCPDNVRHAQGPDLYGCGCQYSRYGCCPDNTTSARGSNNEGCACDHTQYGCCPNHVAAASGSNFEGCPCHTYQFGCCADGVSIAKGPESQGCGCGNTEFKCCSDSITPAKGENYVGCTCDASKYGCCPDGVKEAQGENFNGCLTVPSRPGAACALEKDRGSCSDFTFRWFFDTEYGGCTIFWYSGCEGNENRFKSQEECKDVCVEPKGRDACFLPKISGPCEGYHPTWYYDTEKKQCGQFIYKGCLGNANRFKTVEDCEELCAIPDDIDGCEHSKEVGPCAGNFTRWYFNKKSDSCEEFAYGGCKANKNNFPTQISCQQKCLTPGRSRDLCGLPPVVGPCRANFNKYYYDSITDTCNEFGFGGCEGNKNNFDDKKSCETRCRKSIDTTTTVQTALPVTNISQNNPTCSLPIDVGPCTDDVTAYYYDISAGACQAFIYGGCDGNANRFQTEEQCERLCGSFQRQDVCNIQADPGPCQGAFVKFYYDPAIRGCREFLYGGCDGNANRFTSVEECESICIHREELQFPGNRTTTLNQEICNEPASIGSCSKGSYKRFYYDAERLNCIAFIYTGCGGNRNRFKSYQSCIETCSPRNEKDVMLEPESKDPCLAIRTECETIPCPYGKEEFVDEQNCPDCQCTDPCRTKVCQEGTRCAVSLVANEDSIGYQSVCRSILKPGKCPKVSNATTCQEECSSDADCDTDFKCCAYGCGSSCLQPASVEPWTTPPPQYAVTVPNSVPEPLAIEAPVEPNVSAEEGSYVILKCAYAGNPKPFITWRKNETLIDNSVSRHSISIDGSLQIVGLYRSDAGTYTCTADNRVAAPVRIQYVLTITPPQEHSAAILGVPNYRVTVTLNSPTVLRCNVVGWPRPIVNWWLGNSMLRLIDNVYEQQRDHSLRIHKVALVNLGIYTCQAYNGIGLPASWSVILQAPGPVYNLNGENQKYAHYLIEPQRRPISTTIRSQTTEATRIQTYKPFNSHLHPYIPADLSVTEPFPEIVPARYSVPVKVNVSADKGPFPEGSEFSIACNVDGYPLPRVRWFKDDNHIQMYNTRITISAMNRLTIIDAEKSDSGRYRCQAANELTSDAHTLDIKVAGIYIHPNCKDNSFFAKCDLIVKGNFCSHQYYAKFCCRSCTEAGLMPARGSHIDKTRRMRRSILSFS